jgi:MFS family permease
MRVNRAWLGLAVFMLPTLLVAMDVTALLLALPRLSAGLGVTNVQQLWISDSYGFMVASLVITMGTLGDRVGRRRLLMIGAAAFAVLSVVAAFAVSPLMLIAARTLVGVAGATLAPAHCSCWAPGWSSGPYRRSAPARRRRCRRPATTSVVRSASRSLVWWPRWSTAAGWTARPTRWPSPSPPAGTFPPARAPHCCTPRGRRSPPACTSPASSPRLSSPGWPY